MQTYYTRRSASAYASASALAKEALSTMRVVAAFGGERRAAARYVGALQGPTDSAVQQARLTGVALGLVFFSLFCTCECAAGSGGVGGGGGAPSLPPCSTFLSHRVL